MAEEKAEKDGFGFDKLARRRAQRSQAVEEGRTLPLNPPFPYRAAPFPFAEIKAVPSDQLKLTQDEE